MRNNTAIVLLLLSVGLFYTFTNVQYRDVKGLNTLAGEYQNVLQNASAIVELRDRLLVTYGDLPRTEIERINKMIPDNIDTVRLAFDLDSMAARYGISIKSVQVAVGTNEDADNVILQESDGVYEKATVSIGFVSNYDNFMRLLADIERNLRIMDIKQVSFQTTETGLYDYLVSVETYWLK